MEKRPASEPPQRGRYLNIAYWVAKRRMEQLAQQGNFDLAQKFHIPVSYWEMGMTDRFILSLRSLIQELDSTEDTLVDILTKALTNFWDTPRDFSADSATLLKGALAA